MAATQIVKMNPTQHAAWVAKNRAERIAETTTVAGLMRPYALAIEEARDRVKFCLKTDSISGLEAIIRQRCEAVAEARGQYSMYMKWKNSLPCEGFGIIEEYIRAARLENIDAWVAKWQDKAGTEIVGWLNLTERKIFSALAKARNCVVPKSCVSRGLTAVFEEIEDACYGD